jgi:hypothetical protein
MKVTLLNYSYSIDFSFEKNNVGTAEKPKIEYKLREKVKHKATLEKWHKARLDIFKMCEQKICKEDVDNFYIYVTQFKDDPKMKSDRRKKLIETITQRMAPWSTEAFFQINGVPELRHNTIAVAYSDNSDDNGQEPIGFILANSTNMRTYIDVICSKGAGSALLKSFVDWSGKRNVQLSSLMNVFQYYPKFGFEFGKCGQYPQLTEAVKALPINTLTDTGKLTKEASNIVSTIRRYKIANPPDKDHKLSCSSKLDPQTYVKNQCFQNGVQMERCIPKRFRPTLRRSSRLNRSPVANRTRLRSKRKTNTPRHQNV